MPKENKHARGRRDTLKRKREENTEREEAHDTDIQDLKKRRSSSQDEAVSFTAPDNDQSFSLSAGTGTNAIEVADRPYYGLLEDEEQEYFRRADELLELNDFPSSEERSLFLANVYREAKGKELKIACSQSCSRLMERLILLSTPQQKKKLFTQFAGNFPHLVSHRFASHCCETLFIQSASIVTDELTGEEKKEEKKEAVLAAAEDGEKDEGGETEVTESMESLFLATLDELEGQLSSLLTDRFASHTLRVLLIILSGRPLEKSSTKSLLQSKKKEKIGINGLDTAPTEFTLNKRTVPESFLWAIEKIISDTIASMDRAFIQVLVGHPTGNPCLQLLLELELTNPNSKKGGNSEQKTLISTLLPDDIAVEGSQSAIFVHGIVYDQIGSRVLETIMTHSPGKLFKQIYRAIFKDRIAALARNEIASYVVIRVLNRLSKEDLEEAVTEISPQIDGLVARNRTNIIKVLLERCQVRRASTEALTNSIAAAYGSDKNQLMLKMADISLETLTAATAPPGATDDGTPAPVVIHPKSTPSQLHGSLLAQAMLKIPGPPAQLIQNALLALPTSTILALSLYQTTTHIIQASLLPSPPNTPSNLLFRRKLINSMISPATSTTASTQPPIITLSLSSAGTHILDSLLHTTTTPTSTSSASLFSLCERIAMTLMPYEALLRDSWTGRIVWRNWSMDLFKRRRADWVKRVKSGDTQGKVNIPSQTVLKSQDGNANAITGKEILGDGIGKPHGKGKGGDKEFGGERQKSAIELAREKFAAQKIAGGKGKIMPIKGFKPTGANAI